MNRRSFLKSSVSFAAIIAISSSHSLAQEHLSSDQKADFAKNFGLENNLQATFQAFQDTQRAVPLSPRAFSEDPMLKTLQGLTQQQDKDYAAVEFWHNLVLDLTSIDHVINPSQDAQVQAAYGEQLGPARSSWAFAIVHMAMFEAMNAFTAKYLSLTPSGYSADLRTLILQKAALGTPEMAIEDGTLIAALSYAAHGVIRQIYPKKKEYIQLRTDPVFQRDIAGPGASAGKRVGDATAIVVLQTRGWSDAYGFTDGSEFPDPLASTFTTLDPKKWRPDPISRNKTALGGLWSHVKPFAISNAEAFRCPPPPGFKSPEFISAYKDVKKLGGWGENNVADDANTRYPTPTTRRGDVDIKKDADGTYHYKDNESFKAIFWGYDGTAFLCAPPRLYNMLATTYARKNLKISDALEFCHFLALINIALGDAGISAWEAKYFYSLARPITYLRNLNADDTPEGQGDDRWTPLGAALTNAGTMGRNFTPPFPAYPSGHAVFGGALFEMLRLYAISLGVADSKFDFISDEYNGRNHSPGTNAPRPLVQVEYSSLAEAEEENGQSRIWMGIHWNFDKTQGIKQGNRIARDIFNRIYLKSAS